MPTVPFAGMQLALFTAAAEFTEADVYVQFGRRDDVEIRAARSGSEV